MKTNSLTIGTSSTISGIIQSTQSKNINSTGGNDSRTETFTIMGVSPGDVVVVSPRGNLGGQFAIGQAWVSANNTVNVRFRNTDGGNVNPPNLDFDITVFQ